MRLWRPVEPETQEDMTNDERKSYVHCIMSMCTDFLMGNLTWETLLSNLQIILTKIEKLE